MSKEKNRVITVVARCRKIKTLKEATRLWNAIDHCSNSDVLWWIMLAMVPWAFRDRKVVNSIKFTY